MNIKNMLNQISNAIEYTSATLSYPNDLAKKEDNTVAVHKGRSFSSETQLNHALENIKSVENAVSEMLEVIHALEGSSGQWAEDWLNELAMKCSTIVDKFNKDSTV